MATQFSAEVIEVKVKKLASGDKSYRIILETEQEEAIQLQQYIAEQVVQVEVK